MGFLEIFIIILGGLFIVLSIFFVGKDSGNESSSRVIGDDFKLTAEEQKIIRERVREVVDSETQIMLEDTDVKLSTLSNEKIMAINEFSDQVIQKIETDHKDIVFLYDMLQKKQEEIKEAVKEADESKANLAAEAIKASEDAKKSIEEAAAMVSEKQRRTAAKKKTEAAQTEDTPAPSETEKPATVRRTRTKAAPATRLSFLPQRDSLPDSDEHRAGNNNEKILELYRQKKSVLEISKALGMGQGEVKLVIDLYAH